MEGEEEAAAGRSTAQSRASARTHAKRVTAFAVAGAARSLPVAPSPIIIEEVYRNIPPALYAARGAGPS